MPPATNREAKHFAHGRKCWVRTQGTEKESHQLCLLPKAVPCHLWGHVWLQPGKPRETKPLQEKNCSGFWLQLDSKQAQHCWASTGREGQDCVTNWDSAMAPASTQPSPGTDSWLGYCSEALERPQRYWCYSWAAPQWPALVFPNLSSKPLKSNSLLVFSWENLSNIWSPMFIYKILPLLQLLQKFHPSARFLFRLLSVLL